MVEALVFRLSIQLNAQEERIWQIPFWSPVRRVASVR